MPNRCPKRKIILHSVASIMRLVQAAVYSSSKIIIRLLLLGALSIVLTHEISSGSHKLHARRLRRPIKDDHRRQTDERLGGEIRETLCLLLLYHNDIYLYTMSRRRVTHYKTYDYNNVILKIPEGVAIISKWFFTITMTTVTALLQPSAHLTYFFYYIILFHKYASFTKR